MPFTHTTLLRSLRVWSAGGDLLQELYGHTAFVYAVDVLGSGELVSSSEDRTVRIWRNGECVQTIAHPAISVWCVRALPNGDIVSGSNDGVARVFTRAAERIADEALIKQFDDSVKQFAIPKSDPLLPTLIPVSTFFCSPQVCFSFFFFRNQVGDLEKEKIPGEEALKVPGKNTGDVKVVRVGNNVEAYQWDAAQGKWEKIGDVVDAIGDSRKTTYLGKEYDYVFDVDLEDGMPPRKLPYNVNENPFTAAQNFIHREELSQTFLDQIANFIVLNTKGATLGAGQPSSDPFSGSRYSGGATQSYGGGVDPFTGGSAYSTSSGVQPMDVQPTSSTGAAAASGYYPKKAYVTIEEAKLPTIVTKILEFNTQVPADSNLALDIAETTQVKKIAETLEQVTKYHTFSFGQPHFAIFAKILSWPADLRFPGLDLFRVFVLHPSAAEHYAGLGENFVRELLNAGCLSSSADRSAKATQNNQMLALRAVANLFKYESGRRLLQDRRGLVIEAAKLAAESDRPPLKQALATVFINYAVLLNSQRDEDTSLNVVVCVLEMVKREQDADVAFRLVVALGTLVFGYSSSKELFVALEGKEAVARLAGHSDAKLSTAAKALLELTK